MSATWPVSRAAASTLAKCSGILAWVSKLSTTLKYFAYSGVWRGVSVALPPQRISTSISSLCPAISAAGYTGIPSVSIFTLSGGLLVNTATSLMSEFCLSAHSTPLPRLP